MDAEVLTKLGIWVFTGLAGANLFFVKRLVSKIDRIDEIERMLGSNHVQVQEQIRILQSQMIDVTSSVKDIADLKTEVGILKFFMSSGKKASSVSAEVQN